MKDPPLAADDGDRGACVTTAHNNLIFVHISWKGRKQEPRCKEQQPRNAIEGARRLSGARGGRLTGELGGSLGDIGTPCNTSASQKEGGLW